MLTDLIIIFSKLSRFSKELELIITGKIVTLYIVCRTSITQSMFFFYRVEREKEGGGLFCLCFPTYLGYKTLGAVYGLTSWCEGGRRNTFKHSGGQASVVGIICPVIVIGLIYLTKVSGDRSPLAPLSLYIPLVMV